MNAILETLASGAATRQSQQDDLLEHSNGVLCIQLAKSIEGSLYAGYLVAAST